MNINNNFSKSGGFTMLEIIMVIAVALIIALLALIIINPVEIFKQSRDSNRISDLQHVHRFLSWLQVDVSSLYLGETNTLYISLPDDENSDCSSHSSLPALDEGWEYHCVSSSNLRNNDGTGWIPVDFNQFIARAPLSVLPVDPINTAEGEFFYSYAVGSWELKARLEADTYKRGGNRDVVTRIGVDNEDDIIRFGNIGIIPVASDNPPNQPGFISFSDVATSTLTASWGSAMGADFYELERSTNSGGPYDQITTTTQLSYNDSDLDPGTAYWYRVRGVNDFGEGDYTTNNIATLEPEPERSIAGTLFDNGSPLANRGLGLAVNGTDVANTVTDGNGNFNFGNIPADEGDTAMIYIRNEVGMHGVTVMVFGPLENLVNVHVTRDALSVRNPGGGPAAGNSDLNTAHNGDADVSAIYTMPASNSLQVANGKKLFIPENQEFNPGGDVQIGTSGITSHMDIEGTFVQSSSNVDIWGNFNQSAGEFQGGTGDMLIRSNLNLSGGTFDAPPEVNFHRNLTQTGSPTFNHNNGKFVLGGNVGGASNNFTVDAPNMNFNVVEINRSFGSAHGQTVTIASGTTVPFGDNPSVYLQNTWAAGGAYSLVNNGTITTTATGTISTFVGNNFTNNGTIDAPNVTEWNHSGSFVNNGTVNMPSVTELSFANVGSGGQNGSFTNSSGASFTAGSNTAHFSVSGSFSPNNNDSTFPTNIFLTLSGSATNNTTVDAPGYNFSSPVVINRSQGSASHNTLTIAAGTTIPLGDNPSVHLRNTWSGGGGYSLTNEGTITTTATGALELLIGNNFTNNNTFSAPNATSWVHDGNVINNGTMDLSSADTFTFRRVSAGGGPGSFTNNAGATFLSASNSSEFNIQGSLVLSENPASFPTAISLAMVGGSPSHTSLDAPGYNFTPPVVINRSFGGSASHVTLTITENTTVPLGDDPLLFLRNTWCCGGGYSLTNNGTITITAAGTADTFVGNNFTNNGTSSIPNATTWDHDGTFVNNGVANMSNVSTLSFSAVASRGGAGSFINNEGSEFNPGSNIALTLTGNFTVSSASTFPSSMSSLTMNAGANRTLNAPGVTLSEFNKNSGATVSLAHDIIAGDININAGTLSTTGSNHNVTVTGNWSNSATFATNQSTTTFSGSNQSISGNTTFYNLAKEIASSDTLTFPAGGTQAITNNLTLKGANGSNLLTLVSSNPGTQWQIDPQGTHNVEFVDVSDSWNVATNDVIDALNSNNGGNNVNWIFDGQATVPNAPQNLSAVPGDTEVNLSWEEPLGDGGSEITDYVVEYKESSAGTWSEFSTSVSTSTTATVTGLTNGVQYDFRVSAVNSVGQGDPSIVAQVIPTQGSPVSDGLILHLAADSIGGLGGGQSIDQWHDMSGNDNHFSSVGNPTYISSGINTKPAVYLGESSGDYIRNDGGVNFSAGSSITTFVVMRPLGWHGSNPGVWRSASNSGGGEFNIFQGSTGRPWIRWSGTNILQPGSGYAVPLNEDVITTWIAQNSSSTEFYADGLLQHSDTHAQSASSFSIHNIGYQNSTGERARGYYGEILIYNKALSVVERESVEQYLGQKWLGW